MKPTLSSSKAWQDKVLGCLLGGAVGDALGFPVEFIPIEEIHSRYGTAGVTGYVEFDDGTGAITDDTQMSLFTATGLLNAKKRFEEHGLCHIPSWVHGSYLCWLQTQRYGTTSKCCEGNPHCGGLNEYLLQRKELFACRAPGITCLTALESGKMGTRENPLNNSKGCGTVMRTAPVGLCDGLNDCFDVGCEISAITHGHPTGIIAGGVMSMLISELMQNCSIPEAVQNTLSRLKNEPDSGEVITALKLAQDSLSLPHETAIPSIGEGWIAEEALAIGVYCALKFPEDFRKGVLTAINITGDSDSTGSITGNILGTALGKNAIPLEWIANLRERTVVETIADALFADATDLAL